MQRKTIGRLLLQQTTEEMCSFAETRGLLVDGKVDLRGVGVRFSHSNLELERFLLEDARLGASRLINCSAMGVSFRNCVFDGAWIAAEGATKASFAGASFERASIQNVTFGPRTLDLRATSFREARLRNVRFRMGQLEGASFAGADLEDVYFRSALLGGADFSGARLRRVSFERATLDGASFADAKLEQMEFWGHAELLGAQERPH